MVMENIEWYIEHKTDKVNLSNVHTSNIEGSLNEFTDYYTDYWNCVYKEEGDKIKIGIALDEDEVYSIENTILSSINIDDTYIAICEKLEELSGVSRWRFKKEFGNRKNEIPFDFVTTKEVMDKIKSIFIAQDKATCYKRFQELLKEITK